MYVYERVRIHPVPDSELRDEALMVGLVAQLSDAVAVPAEGKEDGLQPSDEEAGHDVNVGASVSTV